MRSLVLIESAFSNCFNFNGRAGGQSYWRFLQFTWALLLAGLVFDIAFLMELFDVSSPEAMRTIFLGALMGKVAWPTGLSFFSLWTPLVLLATLLPLQSLTARRLHDVGYSAKFMVLLWGPLVVAPVYFTLITRVDVETWTAGFIAANTSVEAVLRSMTYFLIIALVGRGVLFCLLAQRSYPRANAWGHPPAASKAVTLPDDPLDGYASAAYNAHVIHTKRGREALREVHRALVRHVYQHRVLPKVIRAKTLARDGAQDPARTPNLNPKHRQRSQRSNTGKLS